MFIGLINGNRQGLFFESINDYTFYYKSIFEHNLDLLTDVIFAEIGKIVINFDKDKNYIFVDTSNGDVELLHKTVEHTILHQITDDEFKNILIEIVASLKETNYFNV